MYHANSRFRPREVTHMLHKYMDCETETASSAGGRSGCTRPDNFGSTAQTKLSHDMAAQSRVRGYGTVVDVYDVGTHRRSGDRGKLGRM